MYSFPRVAPIFRIVTIVVLLVSSGCMATSRGQRGPGAITPSPAGVYAIAVHGGATGATDRYSESERQESLDALAAVLRAGRDALAGGARAVDVVEQVIRTLEDDPKFNAGRGAVYTANAVHELDASIMDGQTLACGAVTGVRTIKNPISLARLVMQRSRHVFLMGAGAEQFADAMGAERVEPAYFDTERRLDQLHKVLEQRRQEAVEVEQERGTVGTVVLDLYGNLAAGTSTGGLTAKRFGRIGDSPIIGAGTYADNRTCAVSCTGIGEEFIRHTVARSIAALMEYRKIPLHKAARIVVFEELQTGHGGVIAVSHAGEIALVFNTRGMYRGAADSGGRFEVAVDAE